MHELSLSEDMLRTALEAAGGHPGRLAALNVRCGTLSGANAESLRFCLKVLCERRGLCDIKVNVTETPAALQCVCGHSWSAPGIFSGCPCCGGQEHDVTGGMEITLESIEVEDD